MDANVSGHGDGHGQDGGADPVIVLDHVRKEFGTFIAVQDADFAIDRGEFFAMLGPSGCGKTTTLRMIAGFEHPTSGRILLEGVDVSHVPPYKRNVNTVFQQYALFPHMTIFENIAFGPRGRGIPENEVRTKVGEMLEIVRLGHLAKRRPSQLSGGQQQRVALARALVNYPSALLLDEPLAALDLKLREAMQLELKRIQREVGITFVFVTHDQGEALTMSDRIAVMSVGDVEQIGTPEEIYSQPASVFVAGFIGSANLLPGTVVDRDGDQAVVELLSGGRVKAAGTTMAVKDEQVTVMLRPERLRVATTAPPPGTGIGGEVTDLIFQGSSARLLTRLADGTAVTTQIDADDGIPDLRPGDPVWLTWAPDAAFRLSGWPEHAGATSTDVDLVQAALDGKSAAAAAAALAAPTEIEVIPAAATPPRARAGVTRRALLVGAGAAAVAGIGVALASAGDQGKGSGATGTIGSGTLGNGADTVRILNWQAYIDPTEDGAVGTVDRFTDATGIDCAYSEDFNDNNEVFNRLLQPVIGVGQTIDYDIICPTNWMAARLKTLGWLEQLPFAQIPNRVNLDPSYLTLPWDPGAGFHLPWQAGLTGIAYNPDLTGRELTSIEDLFDPEFAGRVAMLTEMRDSVGLTMMALGYDPTVVDVDGMHAALDRIEAAKNDGQIRAFTGNEYLRSLESGDFVACVAWSGDVVQLQYTMPNIRFLLPEAGAMTWFDTMVIPKGAPNGVAAAEWMNFVYDPVQAAQLTYWVQYVTPVVGVRDELIKLGDDAAALAESPILFPSDEERTRLKVFATLPDDIDAEISNRFLTITGA